MTRLTLLSENTAPPGRGLVAEHGLAFLMETEDRTLLFDTGQGPALLPNARALGKDLRKVDGVILSHGHYDHTGGLDALSSRTDFDLYCHPHALLPKPLLGTEEIGCPVAVETLESRGIRIQTATEPMAITPEIRTTGTIPMTCAFERVNPEFLPDTIEDDLGMVIDSPRGPVLLTGCSHRGILNMIHHTARTFGIDHFHGILGGFHLMGQPMEQIRRVFDGLSRISFDWIATGHCTGFTATSELVRMFPGKAEPFRVGATWSF